jgi:hypothetical protein
MTKNAPRLDEADPGGIECQPARNGEQLRSVPDGVLTRLGGPSAEGTTTARIGPDP